MNGTYNARNQLSKALIHEPSSFRYVPYAEEVRVADLLQENHADTTPTGVSASLGHTAILNESGVDSVEDAPSPQAQQDHKEIMRKELAISRESVKKGIVEGVDDTAVDARLGLRGDACLLPPLFSELHRRAEEKEGHEITFLKWMTDYATDEQLTNVWQWHDTYLSERDNDPAFQERIARVKAEYTRGLQAAVDAGILHPDMAPKQSYINAIQMVHGSPFSPMLAVARAQADEKRGLIEMREGVREFTLYHELTHLQSGGLPDDFNEAVTDLIAAEVYNQAHPQEPLDRDILTYHEQAATLAALERMTGGKVNLYELSSAFAGFDSRQNELQLVRTVDDELGLSVCLALMMLSVEARETVKAHYSNSFNFIYMEEALHIMTRRRTEFLADMMFDGEGNKVAGTISELALRMRSQLPENGATQGLYDRETVVDGINFLRKIQDVDNQLDRYAEDRARGQEGQTSTR